MGNSGVGDNVESGLSMDEIQIYNIREEKSNNEFLLKMNGIYTVRIIIKLQLHVQRSCIIAVLWWFEAIFISQVLCRYELTSEKGKGINLYKICKCITLVVNTA